MPVLGAVPVPLAVLGCWASASDTVRTVGAMAKLNAASPRIEKALRREITFASVFSVMSSILCVSPPPRWVKLEYMNTT